MDPAAEALVAVLARRADEIDHCCSVIIAHLASIARHLDVIDENLGVR